MYRTQQHTTFRVFLLLYIPFNANVNTYETENTKRMYKYARKILEKEISSVCTCTYDTSIKAILNSVQ